MGEQSLVGERGSSIDKKEVGQGGSEVVMDRGGREEGRRRESREG